MKPLIETNPRLAPWVAALIAAVLSLAFAFFEQRALVSALLEALALAVVLFFVVRAIGGRDRS